MRSSSSRTLILTAASMVMAVTANGRESVAELLREAGSAIEKRDFKKAVDLCAEAIKLEPKNARCYLLRGVARELGRENAKAVADLDQALKFDDKLAEAYQIRGQARFKLGRFEGSLADFDKYLELRPERRPGHWQRGITCYYVGKFAEGRKQFESYEAVDTNDVENAAWRFLCQAREDGVEKARAAMLKIGLDRRVPLMEIYALYCGRTTPEAVLAAAEKDKPGKSELRNRLFYAHLYLALYYEALADGKKAASHMQKAAEDYSSEHYLGDFARVHWQLLKETQKKK